MIFSFHAPQKLPDAKRALSWLHSLFEISLGQRLRFLKIEIETTHGKKESPGAPALPLHELYWSYCNEGINSELKPTHSRDSLINPEGAVANVVGIGRGAISGNVTIPF